MAEVKTQCASCQKTIRAPEKFAGRSAQCPRCKSPISFPKAAKPQEPAAAAPAAANPAPRAAEAPPASAAVPSAASPSIPGINFPLPVPPVPLGAAPQLPPLPHAPAPSTSPMPHGAPSAGPPTQAPQPTAPLAPIPTVMPPQEELADNSGLVPLAPAPQVDSIEPPAPVQPIPVVEDSASTVPPIQIDTGAAAPTRQPAAAQPAVMAPAADEPAEANPFHIDTGGGGGKGAGAAQAPSPETSPADASYSPILRLKGSKMSMGAKQVNKILGKLQRGKVTSCKQYQLGPDKSFWERVHTLGVFPQEFEMEADEVHVLTASDQAGEFHLAMPFDKGVFCPVEYVSLMSGALPTSLGLMRGKGGNWGLRVTNTAPGSLLHPTMQSILSAAGGQADAVWTVLDANDPSRASDVLNQDQSLTSKLKFDSRLKLGMMEVTYQLDWLAQALPIGPEHYLLIARYIPRNKTMSIEFGVDWFLKWRDQFHRKTSSLPAGNGLFCPFEHGLWSAVAHELMGIHVL